MNAHETAAIDGSRRRDWVLRIAAVLALIALAMMEWSIFDPRPFIVVAALSAGQLLGTASFAMYLVVVATDLGLHLRRRRQTSGAVSKARPKSPV